METGNNIKRIANILYTVAVIAAILMGIGALISIGIASDLGFGGFLLGLLAAGVEIALGVFAAWVIKTLITGFGELVENSAVIRKNTTPEETPTEEAIPAKTPVMAARHSEPFASAAKPRQSETAKQAEVKEVCPIPVGHNRIRCPKCNAEQPMNSKKCSKCGQAFIHE